MYIPLGGTPPLCHRSFKVPAYGQVGGTPWRQEGLDVLEDIRYFLGPHDVEYIGAGDSVILTGRPCRVPVRVILIPPVCVGILAPATAIVQAPALEPMTIIKHACRR